MTGAPEPVVPHPSSGGSYVRDDQTGELTCVEQPAEPVSRAHPDPTHTAEG